MKTAKEKQPYRNPEDLVYYVTIFKLDGHDTWRAHLGQKIDSLDHRAKNDKYPKITERKILKVDRITVELTMKEVKAK